MCNGKQTSYRNTSQLIRFQKEFLPNVERGTNISPERPNFLSTSHYESREFRICNTCRDAAECSSSFITDWHATHHHMALRPPDFALLPPAIVYSSDQKQTEPTTPYRRLEPPFASVGALQGNVWPVAAAMPPPDSDPLDQIGGVPLQSARRGVTSNAERGIAAHSGFEARDLALDIHYINCACYWVSATHCPFAEPYSARLLCDNTESRHQQRGLQEVQPIDGPHSYTIHFNQEGGGIPLTLEGIDTLDNESLAFERTVSLGCKALFRFKFEHWQVRDLLPRASFLNVHRY